MNKGHQNSQNFMHSTQKVDLSKRSISHQNFKFDGFKSKQITGKVSANPESCFYQGLQLKYYEFELNRKK